MHRLDTVSTCLPCLSALLKAAAEPRPSDLVPLSDAVIDSELLADDAASSMDVIAERVSAAARYLWSLTYCVYKCL